MQLKQLLDSHNSDLFIEKLYEIFQQSTRDYHINDNVDFPAQNPYEKGSFEALLFDKNQIDAVQWHLEDIIRDPEIDPVKALEIKRRIDKLNQHRTDLVEHIDDFFLNHYKNVVPSDNLRLSTESPGWAIDRLSILALKIFHMQEQANRTDADAELIARSSARLGVLLQQQNDLMAAIAYLLDEMTKGIVMMKVYRQMKLYNDPLTNPILYSKK